MDIRDIHNPWRDAFMPAQYKGAQFFVESGGPESGRRIVEHEFPKRDQPYAEDMGRRAIRVSVRAYCIQSARQPDYRQPRNALRSALETGGGGRLQLPFINLGQMVCERYKLTEEDKYGGYCVFDISFVEAGAAGQGTANTATQTIEAAQAMSAMIVQQITTGPLALR
jgi:prophage DNA circulation protein